MKNYYKSSADKAEKQLKLLVPGFEIKVKGIGLKLTETDSEAEKEQLIQDLLDMADVVQDVRHDYESNSKRYQELCEKENAVQQGDSNE